MKFIAAEITELVKITKQEFVALATTRNEILLLLIDILDSTVLLSYVQNTYVQVIKTIRKFVTILDATNTTRFYI